MKKWFQSLGKVRAMAAGRLRGDEKGQALIEFCLLVIIALMLCLGTIEMGSAASLSLRISSAVYEAGRMINAQALWPVTTNTSAQNTTFLQNGLTNDIYPAIKSMVYPSNIASKGTVIFTYITRVPTDTNASDDRLQLTYQFKFPSSSSQSSKVPYTLSGSGTNSIKLVGSGYVSMDALLSNQSTVVVEIYHQTDPMTAKLASILGLAKKVYSNDNSGSPGMDYIYDFAIY